MQRDEPALIQYTHEPITPLPWVYESNTEATWRLFDAAMRMQDAISHPRNLGDLT